MNWTIGQDAYDVNTRMIHDNGEPIAFIKSGPKRDEHAALLAAAPEMLFSLRWIVERLNRGGKAAASDVLSQAKYAIAKATNRP